MKTHNILCYCLRLQSGSCALVPVIVKEKYERSDAIQMSLHTNLCDSAHAHFRWLLAFELGFLGELFVNSKVVVKCR